jgi:Skp family chaperone for outer membrane proteins
MIGMRAVALCLGWLFLATAGVAQQTSILTIDSERMFSESAFGQQVELDLASAIVGLAAENRQIEEALTAEELSLTERRPTLEPQAFRAEAAAFDEKVQGIRLAQDAKERALQQIREVGQRNFLQQATPILGELMRERGATVILERRSVFGSLDSIDVTEEAIVRVDILIADDGAAQNTPETPEQTDETLPQE